MGSSKSRSKGNSPRGERSGARADVRASAGPSGFKRERVGERILGFLSSEIRQYEDPRFLGISLTAVDMSPDLKHARIFWSFYSVPAAKALSTESSGENKTGNEAGDGATVPPPIRPEVIRAAESALEGASYALKRRVAEELQLRFTPRLVFLYDPTLETAARIEALMKSTREKVSTV